MSDRAELDLVKEPPTMDNEDPQEQGHVDDNWLWAMQNEVLMKKYELGLL